MSASSPRVAGTLWRQLPFLVWLVALWMLLWGQFTVLAAVTGLVVAVVVTVTFRLPPVELSGRLNLWWAFVFVVVFFGALIKGSLIVAWQVINPFRQPGTAVIAVPLDTRDDLTLTHVAITSSLIPGSLIVDIDRSRSILYLHAIGISNQRDVENQRAVVRRWEARIIRAFGSRAQLDELRQRSSGAAAREVVDR